MGSPCLQLPDGTWTLTAAQSCKGWQQPWHPALPCARSRAPVAAMAQGQSWGLLSVVAPPSCCWLLRVLCLGLLGLLLCYLHPPALLGLVGLCPPPGCSRTPQSCTHPGLHQQQRGCRGGTKQDKPWRRAGLGAKLLTFKYWGRPLRGGGQGASAGAAWDFSGWVKCWDLN